MNELYHHGVKGQKWGVRRFQNEDGTLTDAGKERYDESLTKAYNESDSDSDYHLNSGTTVARRIQSNKDEDSNGKSYTIYI